MKLEMRLHKKSSTDFTCSFFFCLKLGRGRLDDIMALRRGESLKRTPHTYRRQAITPFGK